MFQILNCIDSEFYATAEACAVPFGHIPSCALSINERFDVTKIVVPRTMKALAFGDDDNKATNNYMSTCVSENMLKPKTFSAQRTTPFSQNYVSNRFKSKHIGNRPSTIEKKSAFSGYFLPITLFLLPTGVSGFIWHYKQWQTCDAFANVAQPFVTIQRRAGFTNLWGTLPVGSSTILFFFSFFIIFSLQPKSNDQKVLRRRKKPFKTKMTEWRWTR